MSNPDVEYHGPSGPSKGTGGALRPDSSYDHRDVKASNISSSTAGASSGDFHLYRNARARELARVQKLREEKEAKVKDDEFERDRAERRKREETKTQSRAQKRRKKKLRAKGRKNALQDNALEGNPLQVSTTKEVSEVVDKATVLKHPKEPDSTKKDENDQKQGE